MTAEVCVMNRMGVAMATDSAVTVGDGWKIHTSADKMFVLTEDSPVGIMIFGQAALDGVPWETIIKMYRAEIGHTTFPALADYVDSFIGFIKKDTHLFTEDMQRDTITWMATQFFSWVLNAIEIRLRARVERRPPTEKQVVILVKAVIRVQQQEIRKTNSQEGLSSDIRIRLKELYEEPVRKERLKILGSFADGLETELFELFLDFLTYQSDELSRTGVVIAGFGSDEYLPSVTELSVQAVLADELLYHKKERFSMIGANRLGYVIPFAQQEMVHAFMRGINPSFRRFVNTTTLDAITSLYEAIRADDNLSSECKTTLTQFKEPVKKALDKLITKLNKHETTQFSDPVMRTIATLPKDELAATAEMLVNLTKFKRKLNAEQLETVGGPIDVAVITKGDGFIWIKRKHYFDSSLNPRFLSRYKQVEEWEKNHGESFTQ